MRSLRSKRLGVQLILKQTLQHLKYTLFRTVQVGTLEIRAILYDENVHKNAMLHLFLVDPRHIFKVYIKMHKQDQTMKTKADKLMTRMRMITKLKTRARDTLRLQCRNLTSRTKRQPTKLNGHDWMLSHLFFVSFQMTIL